MPGTTPGQGWRVPISSDDPDVVDDVTQLAKLIEKRVMAVYANTADRDAKTAITGLEEGMFAYLRGSNSVTYYDGATWVVFPPAQPAITHGTTLPSNTDGSDGDIYFRL